MTATRDLLHSFFFKSRVYSTSLYTTVLFNCYPMCGDLCVPNILQLQIMIQQTALCKYTSMLMRIYLQDKLLQVRLLSQKSNIV